MWTLIKNYIYPPVISSNVTSTEAKSVFPTIIIKDITELQHFINNMTLNEKIMDDWCYINILVKYDHIRNLLHTLLIFVPDTITNIICQYFDFELSIKYTLKYADVVWENSQVLTIRLSNDVEIEFDYSIDIRYYNNGSRTSIYLVYQDDGEPNLYLDEHIGELRHIPCYHTLECLSTLSFFEYYLNFKYNVYRFFKLANPHNVDIDNDINYISTSNIFYHDAFIDAVRKGIVKSKRTVIDHEKLTLVILIIKELIDNIKTILKI